MRPAPSPDDVLWSNLRLRRWEVAVRRQLLTGVLVVLVLFYAIPVGAVQAILQVGCVLASLQQLPAHMMMYSMCLISFLVVDFQVKTDNLPSRVCVSSYSGGLSKWVPLASA
jgi:hypothetical protein